MDWKCFLILCLTGLGMIAASGWVTPQVGRRYSLSLNQTLELKTTGNLAGKMVFLDFISPSGNYHLVFKCKDVSSSEWEYLIKGCMIDNWRFSIIMNSVPTDDIKVWRITRTSTRLVIVCNGVIVVNFNFATDFKDGFDGCLDLWTSKSTAVAFPYVHGVYGPMVMRININGGYTDFGDWSECSVECGGGTQTRNRTCTNPAPANGGADCVGDSSETRNCNTHLCPINGGYTDFGDWSECSVECGGGIQTRTRTCTNPAPAHGGADCEGDSSETRECNTHPCPIDGGYTDFGDWSECFVDDEYVNCDGGFYGHRTRTRNCTNPAPANGGADCVGDASETQACTENDFSPDELESSDSGDSDNGEHKSDSALEEFREGILYGYVVDSEAADYLSRGDVIFKVPNHLIAVSSDSRVHKTYDYFDSENTAAKSLAISAKVEGHYGAFSAAASMQVTKDSDSSFKTVRLDATVRAFNYSVRSIKDFRTNPENYLTPNFKRAVMKYSCEEIERYIGIFYAKQFILGAKFRKTYKMDALSTDTESSVTAELEAKYGGSLIGVSADAKYGTSSRDSNSDLKINVDWKAYGGDPTKWLGTAGGTMTDWAKTITDENLHPFDFELDLIWDLVKKVNKVKGDKFQEYLEEKWYVQASLIPTKFYGDGECYPRIPAHDSDQGGTLDDDKYRYGPQNAIDGDFGTQAGALNWLKLNFVAYRQFHWVRYYYKYFTDWPYEKDGCHSSVDEFKRCVAADTGVKVLVYNDAATEENEELYECGTISLSDGLSRSDQIYDINCYGAKGISVKLEKESGVITVFELEVFQKC